MIPFIRDDSRMELRITGNNSLKVLEDDYVYVSQYNNGLVSHELKFCLCEMYLNTERKKTDCGIIAYHQTALAAIILIDLLEFERATNHHIFKCTETLMHHSGRASHLNFLADKFMIYHSQCIEPRFEECEFHECKLLSPCNVQYSYITSVPFLIQRIYSELKVLGCFFSPDFTPINNKLRP